MLSWLAANIGTVLITILLIAIVVVIVVKLWKDKKKGVSSCGGNCAHCAMSGTCHQKK
ncbi:MAG: FeoB-associated Cys-rich membrane protein [Clostridia bacterium]|nr:FeoB-associated Cys-rich membrane protein [Clostridia bacterium]